RRLVLASEHITAGVPRHRCPCVRLRRLLPDRQPRARKLIEALANYERALLNTQVLREFYVAVTRRLRVPVAEAIAQEALETLLPLAITGLAIIAGVAAASANAVASRDPHNPPDRREATEQGAAQSPSFLWRSLHLVC
ncbi:MAG: hypothetical protein MUQ56_02710, partial [Thermoleophilia bacterium]|nr:hypothetical protein [Thermoleophilia bacterium]